MDINLTLKDIKNEYEYYLINVSKEYVGIIPKFYILSLKRKLNDIDELEGTIPKYIYDNITLNKKEYVLYKEFSNEKYIKLDNGEEFVIKNITDNHNDTISFVAYSKEKKLQKINVKFEEVYLNLFTSDIENDIFALNDLLYQDTGWKIDHVDEDVGYLITTNEEGEETKEERLRWQESVNTNWYDFLKSTITEQFDCLVFFNTSNNTISLYKTENFGERLELYLAKDQYIEDLTQKSDSAELITRLQLEGSEEMDIVGATASGYTYLENYSYYIDNHLMRQELIDALLLYYHMVEIRTPLWNELVEEKLNKNTILLDKQRDMTNVQANLIACTSMINSYNAAKDPANEAIWVAKKAEYMDKETILYNEIKKLEEEIIQLDEAILNMNILCKKETATDEEGHLIFTQELLDELKEFISMDTWKEDSYLEVKDFIEAGKRKLEKICKPTTSFEIDVVNFLSRLIDNNFRKHWNGVLGLGDVIILYDKENDIENFVYLVDFTQKFSENTLSLTLSNKKDSSDNARDIADYLRDAKYTKRALESKTYLLLREKYNKY